VEEGHLQSDNSHGRRHSRILQVTQLDAAAARCVRHIVNDGEILGLISGIFVHEARFPSCLQNLQVPLYITKDSGWQNFAPVFSELLNT